MFRRGRHFFDRDGDEDMFCYPPGLHLGSILEAFWRPWAHFWIQGVPLGRFWRGLKMRSKKGTLKVMRVNRDRGGPLEGDPQGQGRLNGLRPWDQTRNNVPKGTVADIYIYIYMKASPMPPAPLLAAGWLAGALAGWLLACWLA